MMSRIGMSRWAVFVWVSEITRSLPQRSQVMRMNHDGKALNGGSRKVVSHEHRSLRSRSHAAGSDRWCENC
jgi:hypothetical protein